jgi:hypothetical protein
MPFRGSRGPLGAGTELWARQQQTGEDKDGAGVPRLDPARAGLTPPRQRSTNDARAYTHGTHRRAELRTPGPNPTTLLAGINSDAMNLYNAPRAALRIARGVDTRERRDKRVQTAPYAYDISRDRKRKRVLSVVERTKGEIFVFFTRWQLIVVPQAGCSALAARRSRASRGPPPPGCG